ncbi:hypothetical protein BJY04DRAFT_211047 [Aspergillus karnatakaensis]|uniref:uncharacterized protein n=1 Tax=Aspergillus karnatakaensis TaxID=1810916 RepID=UPI003CCCA42A
MSDRTSSAFRTGPPSPSSPAPFSSLKDSIQPHPSPHHTPQTPTSPPLMSVSAPNNASDFASLQALPSQATSQSASLSSPPSSAPMSTQTSQQPTAGVTNSFPTPASSVDPDHLDKSFTGGVSEAGLSSTTGAAPVQQADHRRTDHDRHTEQLHTGTGVRDFAGMDNSTRLSRGDAMELDTETSTHTNSNWPSLESLQKDFSSAFHLCKSSHVATGPDPSIDLISLYGLGPIAKSVARNDPVTGEKINRLRKSYEGKLKGLGLAGRNKPVKHDPTTPGGLRQLTMWPEEEWQNQKVFGKDIRIADMDSALHNLQMKAMKMEPGPVPNNDYWEDVLGHDKPTKNTNAGESTKRVSTPAATNIRAVSQSNGTLLSAEASRPSRGRKRNYDDNSFVGYGEGYADDDDEAAFYSNGEGNGKKKRKKDHMSKIPAPLPDRGGSYGMASAFEKTLALIDAAHAQDPTLTTPPDSTSPIPYELHYANKMTKYLSLRLPAASPTLRLAVRAQHLKRWEVPRTDFPATKLGYHSWRTHLAKRQAEIAKSLCLEGGMGEEVGDRVAQLVRKEGLKGGEDEEVQALEDVACLVFLEDQLEGFQEGYEEEKVIGILRRTWAKMSERGRELALEMELGGRSKELVQKALADA